MGGSVGGGGPWDCNASAPKLAATLAQFDQQLWRPEEAHRVHKA